MARSCAFFMVAMTLSARALTFSCRFCRRGTSLLSKPWRSGLASQSSSTFFNFSRVAASCSSVFFASSSASMAVASISLAGMSVFSLLRGLPLSSACVVRSSAAARSSPASSMIFWTSCLCSSSFLCLSASSARFCLAFVSDCAMATFRCIAWNFSKVMGSKMRMILSRTPSVGSKPSNVAFEKARTSARLSLPSLSVSCVSKDALLSRSFFSADALRRALSRVMLTVYPSLSNCLLPS
mmetsp:Transcript_63873/g.190342  ORF Transcript_63873/g.190342 Transcript_63873/m.190342 type:complete len:239 (-) Transcript_63873:1228-1944(-)